MQRLSRFASLVALALGWLGYFSPWLWPVPAALRLSAHDLVEWMTFMQTVRDGTFPITRLDILWPLASISLLTAAFPSLQNEPQRCIERREYSTATLSGLGALAVNNWLSVVTALLSLVAAFLILPAYPFVLTAYNDPDLAPQFWLGVAAGAAALLLSAFAVVRRAWARWLIPVVALAGLLTAIRAYNLIQPPFTDLMTQPVPIGYGVVLIVIGFGALVLLAAIDIGGWLIPRRT